MLNVDVDCQNYSQHYWQTLFSQNPSVMCVFTKYCYLVIGNNNTNISLNYVYGWNSYTIIFNHIADIKLNPLLL